MSEALANLSESLAATVAAASPAVVRVEARRRLPASGIAWSENGLVLTASHVVRHDEDIKIGLADGRSVSARLVGRDDSTDLALLQADVSGLVPLTIAADDQTAVGHLALALGRPGKTVQATLGIISALGDSWRTRAGGLVDRYLQTDVVMYPGFSGGPLVGAGPQLFGMSTSALTPGVSVAIPATTLNRVAGALQTHGRMRRGYLGVSTQRVRLPQALAEERQQKAGLLVISVEPGSPADEGGITLGDTIIGAGETIVGRHDDLLAQLSGDVVGQKIPLTVLRGGVVQTMNVRVGERP
jgi:S1-C subfamily serine protease